MTPNNNTVIDTSEAETVKKNKKIYKKDDFNYKKFVDNEMKKLNADNLDPYVKKKME